MKILYISPDKRDINKVACYTDVWSHYLGKELERRGAELIYSDMVSRSYHKHPVDVYEHYERMPLDGIDHIFGTGLRYFSTLPSQVGSMLRRRIPGAVVQFADAPLSMHAGVVDCTFTARALPAMPAGQVCVGWAADDQLLVAQQPFDQLVIVIDHPDYSPGAKRDRTAEITASVMRFVEGGSWKVAWGSVRVRRIVDGGFEDMALDGTRSWNVPTFHRQHVPFPEAVKEYCLTHIFLPTHPESVGLTALEMAMCGAIVVAPKGFIPPDRMATIRHIEFGASITWQQVLQSVSVPASRTVAQRNSWDAVGQRVFNFLDTFKKGSTTR